MPQMAPLMWTMLFMFFTSILLMVMIKIFISKMNTTKNLLTHHLNVKKSTLNWKW